MLEMQLWVQSLGQEDPLKEGTATHSSILMWRIPRTEKPGGLQSTASQRFRHDWTDLAGIYVYMTCLYYNSSVTQLYPTLCDPVDCSMPGFPLHHKLLELAQTHVHWVSDAIQPYYPLSSPSPPAFNLSKSQGLFQGVSSLHQVAKSIEISASASVFPMNVQDWFPISWTGWISLQSKGLSRVFSNTTVQKY